MLAEPGQITPTDPVPSLFEIIDTAALYQARVEPGVTYVLESQTSLTGWQTVQTYRPIGNLIDATLFSSAPPSAATQGTLPVRLHRVVQNNGPTLGTLAVWESPAGGLARSYFSGVDLPADLPVNYRRTEGVHQFEVSFSSTLPGAPADLVDSQIDQLIRSELDDLFEVIFADSLDDELVPSETPVAVGSISEPRRFWRYRQVLTGDSDWDADGLSNRQEINSFNTDPFLRDSDLDGYNDLAEASDTSRSPNFNELTLDINSLPPGLGDGLELYYEFEERRPGNTRVAFFENLAGSDFSALTDIRFAPAASENDGSLSRSARIGNPASTIFVETFGNFIQSNANFTVSLWFRCDAGALSNPGTRTLFAFNNQAGAPLFAVEASDNIVAGRQVLRISSLDGSPNPALVNVPRTTHDLDDGQWRHFLISRTAGSAYVVYLDGVLQGQIQSNSTGLYPATSLILGSVNTAAGQTHLQGNLDRVLIYDRAVSAAEITILSMWRKDDADGDGMLDAEEMTEGTDPRISDLP